MEIDPNGSVSHRATEDVFAFDPQPRASLENKIEIRLAILLEPGEFGNLRHQTKLGSQVRFCDPASDSHLQAERYR